MAELFHFLCTIQFVHGRLYLIPDVEYPILATFQIVDILPVPSFV